MLMWARTPDRAEPVPVRLRVGRPTRTLHRTVTPPPEQMFGKPPAYRQMPHRRPDQD